MFLRTLFISACLTFQLCLFAQGRYDLHNVNTQTGASSGKNSVDLFVRGNPDDVKKATKQADGIFKYGYGQYNSVTIPIKNLDLFLKNPVVLGAQNGEVPIVPLCDTAIIVNCVKPVHDGDAPLDTSYLGDGVILGVIDYGIDINHEDFKKSNGDTRIRYLWDQNVGNTNSPVPYNYGREWTQFEIDSGLCTHDEHVLTSASHGTTVAGIAAGNGRACNGRYVGMAPNTDLMVVAINYQSSFLSHFVDAVDYIFKKADAMGKPCVINGSFGAYWGSHDGKDFAAHTIDALLEQRPGRVLVCAAGNAGGLPFHLGYDVTADTSFTWFKFLPQPFNDVYFDFWADTQDLNNVYFAIGTDDPNTWNHLDESSFFNIPNDYVFNVVPPDTIASINFAQRDSNSNFYGNVATTIYLTEGRYNVNVDISGVTNVAHYWSLITTGSGRVDGWNSSLLGVDQSDMVTSIPPPSIRPDIVNYKLPDLGKTTASSFTCSDKVITVGNFVNRAHYPDCDSNIVNTNAVPGMIGGSSSHGPTRDGRIKPDVTATGDFTLGSGNAAQIAISLNNADRYKVGYCCKYFRNGGTSMASPVVAGIAALYLEKNPNADWEEAKQAIITTTKVDSFTGSVPNNTYGYGKVQACSAMLYHAVFGCTDSTAFNYDSLATIDDGSCIEKIYGCTDSTAFNYDSLANTDDSSCIAKVYGCTDSTSTNFNPDANTDDGTCIPVGINSIQNQNIKLEFIPNFFEEQSRIVFDLGGNHSGLVIITNIIGQKIDEIPLSENSGELLYNFPSKESGVFFYHLVIDKKPLLSGKIVIY